MRGRTLSERDRRQEAERAAVREPCCVSCQGGQDGVRGVLLHGIPLASPPPPQHTTHEGDGIKSAE